jgi:2-iminobutanoate/2-iminopropanoate deaminase
VAGDGAEPTTRRALSTGSASKPVARYSQGIAAGGLVFSAGQGAHDPVTGELPEGIEAQTRRTLENVDAILRAGGASLATALKITVYLAERQDYAAMNAVYDTYMPDAPAVRTTVQAGLGQGMLVEIDAIALAEG